MTLSTRCTALAVALSAIAIGQVADPKVLLRRGVSNFRDARYSEAAERFKLLTEAAPQDANAFLYLGITNVVGYIPGANSPQNIEFGGKAEAAFHRALELSPDNKLALMSLGLLLHAESLGDGTPSGRQKAAESKRCLERLVEPEPQRPPANYAVGGDQAH